MTRAALTLPALRPHINGLAWLQWDVQMNSVAQIEVRLLRRLHGHEDETLFTVTSSSLSDIEIDVRDAWEAYRVVEVTNGRLDPEPPRGRPIRDVPQA